MPKTEEQIKAAMAYHKGLAEWHQEEADRAMKKGLPALYRNQMVAVGRHNDSYYKAFMMLCKLRGGAQ